MSADLPRAISESTLYLAGHRLRVFQLSDGQRIIDADDFVAFMAALENDLTLTPEQYAQLADHVNGPRQGARSMTPFLTTASRLPASVGG